MVRVRALEEYFEKLLPLRNKCLSTDELLLVATHGATPCEVLFELEQILKNLESGLHDDLSCVDGVRDRETLKSDLALASLLLSLVQTHENYVR